MDKIPNPNQRPSPWSNTAADECHRLPLSLPQPTSTTHHWLNPLLEMPSVSSDELIVSFQPIDWSFKLSIHSTAERMLPLPVPPLLRSRGRAWASLTTTKKLPTTSFRQLFLARLSSRISCMFGWTIGNWTFPETEIWVASNGLCLALATLLDLMAGSFGEGTSSRSKRGVGTLREPSAWHTFDRKELKKEEFEKRVVVYENYTDVDDINNYFTGFLGLAQAQSWG